MDLQDIRAQLRHTKDTLREACLFLERLEEGDYKDEKGRENLETDLEEILKELNIEF